MEVQKVENISYAAFMQEFYLQSIPANLKNAAKGCKGKGLFSPEWFGDRQTEIAAKKCTLLQIIDMKEDSLVDQPSSYPRFFNIPETLPAILDLIHPLHLNYTWPNWLDGIWFTSGYWGSATELFIERPGETLFIVFWTWHTTCSFAPTISVSIDQLSSRDFKDFVGDALSFNKKESTVQAMAEIEYSRLARQTCKLDNSICPQK
jgi:hypothetical protein